MMKPTSDSYAVEVAGLRRQLPLFEVAPGVRIAIVNILGDSELVLAASKGHFGDLVKDKPKAMLRLRGKPILGLARTVLALAREGLTRRRRLDRMGGDESHFLNALDRIANTGVSSAEEKLALYHGRWRGSVAPVYSEFAY